MISSDAFRLERLILHVLDNSIAEPSLAQEEIPLTDEISSVFESYIASALEPRGLKHGKFYGADGTVATCCTRMVSEETGFVEDSQVMAMWLFQHMVRNENIVPGDFAVCLFVDIETENRYVALLKLAIDSAYERKFEDGHVSFQSVEDVLPQPGKGLHKCAVCRAYFDGEPFDLVYKDFQNRKDEDADVANFWREQFLECEEVATARELTQTVVRETGNWIKAHEDILTNQIANDLHQAVKESIRTDQVDLEKIAGDTIPFDDLKDSFIERMETKGVKEPVFTPDRVWGEKAGKKTTYVLDDGVIITGPSDVIDSVVQMLPKTDDGRTRIVIESRRFYQK